MTPYRSTFSIAQLCLLTMLSGLIFAWLPKAVEWDDQHWDYDRFQAKLSDDATRMISFDSDYGFTVFDTSSGKCLMRQVLSLECHLDTDRYLTKVLTFPYSKKEKQFHLTVFDVDTQDRLDRLLLEPLPDHRASPGCCDSDGMLVQFDYPLPPGSESPLWDKPVTLRHWDPRTGKVIREYVTEGCRQLDFVEDVPGGGLLLLGHLAKPSPHLPCFVEWRDASGSRRTKIPPQGSFSPSLICMSGSGDRALLYQIHGLSGEPEGPHTLLLCERETGEIHDLGKSDFASIRPAQFTADNKDLIGVGEDFGGTRRRLIKMDLDTLKWTDLDVVEALGISDLKLLDGGRSLAIATIAGDFRVIDLATGNTLRHRTGLRYYPPRAIWYVLGSLAVVWVVLWWKASGPRKIEAQDWGRYLGLLVFVVALAVGLLLLGYRDERLRRIHVPTMGVAVVIASLGTFAGGVSIFFRRFNKLAALYTLVACAGIMAYLYWLLYRTF